MNITTLRQALAVRRHGSFARAAAAIGVSQPSLSKTIARLEDQLKGPLFVRSARGVELTPLGELVLDHAAKVIQEADNLEQAAKLAAGGASSLLRVGFGPELKSEFASRLLEATVRRYSKLNLRLDVSDRRRLLSALAARELDVVFCIMDPAVEEAGEVIVPCLETVGMVVAAPDHPLAQEDPVTAERLLQFPHAGPRNDYYSVKARFGLAAAPGHGGAYEGNDFEPFMPLVLAGLSTIRLPAFVAAPYLAAGRLVRLKGPLEPPLRYAGVATRAAATSPIVRFILAEAAEMGRAIWPGQAKPSSVAP